MTTTLQTRLEALYGRERQRARLGLEGTRALLAALGDPHTRFRSVHVAGTNGKGTTCALVERVLREAGYRTGLYTSPHLVDFRERIRVAGQWANEEWLDEKLTLIEGLPEGRDRTFFEVATALGFLYFAEMEVEIAVVEVGLGGRLDCTNVITPEVCVITTIGLDHTEILGATLEDIAREKAGILKPGVPVVLPHAPDRALRVIEAIALERGAPIAASVGDPAPPGPERLAARERALGGPLRLSPPDHPPPRGERPPPRMTEAQESNRARALAALAVLLDRGFAIPAEAVSAGIAAARWPGRFERCPSEPRLWWDAAHNAQGFRELGAAWNRARLGRTATPGIVVLALSRDKDVESILVELRRAFRPLRLIVTRSRSDRAMDPGRIAAEARAQRVEAPIALDVVSAVRHALDSTGDGEVLLCGSIFAIGDAMEAFGGAPGEWL